MIAEIELGDVPQANASRLGARRWAVRHGNEALSWGELAERVQRRAHALAEAGIGQDDIVALALPNSNTVYEFTFALWKLGATPMPVSAKLPAAELHGVLQAAEAKWVVTAQPGITAQGVLPPDFGAHHLNAAPMTSRTARHWKVMTSGGSTGRPKVIVDHQSSRMPIRDGVLFLPKDGVMLNPAPLYHNFPFALTHMAMMGGASVVGMEKFDAETALKLIERWQVQWVNLVPTMMDRMARLPADVRSRYDLSSLETVWHTAAPIPPWLKEQWIDWIGPERIWEMYGGSEGFCTTQLNGTEWLAHRGSVGRSVIGEVTIRGEDGAMLPAGEVGEIYMRGPADAKPTYHYVGADSRRLPDGFESFGDFGWLDEDGYLYIADRRTDLILTGGANVYPAEVEAALMEHPRVQTAVVIGLPDEQLGAVPHAIILPEPDGPAPSEAELREFASERLVRYKTPRSYEFTDQPLRDEAGKVRRNRLRADRIAAG
jgi:bile acid-coenzyme A ligase